MESLKRNYDRVALVVAALLAIVGGGLLAKNALGLSDSFERADPEQREGLGEGGAAAAEMASKHLGESQAWGSPAMPGIPQKKLPLFVSVPILVQNGVEIDLLDPASASPRPPFTSDYLYKHRLPVGRTDLAGLDPDNDGFDNEEEFSNGRTDPNDPESHPPYALKLSLGEVKKDEYILSYRTGDNPDSEFGLREETILFETTPPRPKIRRKSPIVVIGTSFGSHPGHKKRYKITAFKNVMKPGGAGGIDMAAHVVTIADSQGEPFQIAYRGRYVRPTYYAIFHNTFPGVASTIGPVKVGDSFELPNEPGAKYELLELSENLENGAKVRRIGASGETPQDLMIPFRKKNG